MQFYGLVSAALALLGFMLVGAWPNDRNMSEPLALQAFAHGAVSAAELGRATAEAKPLVMVELFTSQGCSSCPPADAIAASLARDPNVLVVTRPVTYWDRLGWKDTLAREDNTILQRAYAAKGLAGSGVYTPQMVVNGGDGAVGSREVEVRKLIETAIAREEQRNVRLTARRLAQGGAAVELAGAVPETLGASAQISVLALSRNESVRVGRGENGGRQLTFTNVLVDETRLGAWHGGPATLAIPAVALRVANADRYAVIARIGATGPVIAARYLR